MLSSPGPRPQTGGTTRSATSVAPPPRPPPSPPPQTEPAPSIDLRPGVDLRLLEVPRRRRVHGLGVEGADAACGRPETEGETVSDDRGSRRVLPCHASHPTSEVSTRTQCPGRVSREVCEPGRHPDGVRTKELSSLWCDGRNLPGTYSAAVRRPGSGRVWAGCRLVCVRLRTRPKGTTYLCVRVTIQGVPCSRHPVHGGQWSSEPRPRTDDARTFGQTTTPLGAPGDGPVVDGPPV